MKFTSFGVSVIGIAHVRQGKPNQDSFCFHNGVGYSVIAVSDGHGSDKYMRSDIGARIAAKETVLLMKEFVENNPELSASTQKRIDESLWRLKRNILYYWRRAVEDFTDENPLPEEAACPEVIENNIIAYGTTLITAAVTKDYILCLQLGDGDIALLYNDDRVFNPMNEDSRLLANETTSMCSDDAIRDFRTYLSFDIPELAAVCTDGISNSFVSYDDFLNLTRDIKDELSANSLEKTKRLLEEGLQRLSKNGSGDDATMAIAIASPKEH